MKCKHVFILDGRACGFLQNRLASIKTHGMGEFVGEIVAEWWNKWGVNVLGEERGVKVLHNAWQGVLKLPI